VLEYFLTTGDVSNQEAFFDLVNEKISPHIGDKVMTFAERMIQQGMQQGLLQAEQMRHEGRQEGKLDVAKQLLAEGIELQVIARATGLSIENIQLLDAVN
jgi:predicted transposase/invertase (TIGR01784 family)